MTTHSTDIPKTQSALRWVRVSETDPFEWNSSTPVIQADELGAKQVLLENHAASLNPVDYKIAALNFSHTTLPTSTGFDVSGRIVAVGKDVNEFQVGDEVFGYLNLNSSRGGGAFQQYTVADVEGLVKKPSNVSHVDAAALGVAYLSAMDGLRQVKIDSTTTIFVPGGSGGVGHYIVQIAKIRGAKRVITSASKDEGIKILRDQYKIADVINHATENIIERVQQLNNGQGVDIVYDSTYLESSMEKSIKTVKEGGFWIVLGHFGDKGSEQARLVSEQKANLVHADIGRYWFGAERAQLKSLIQENLAEAARWIGEGKLKPHINQIIQLDQVKETLEKMKQGKTGFGKILVQHR